MILEPKGKNIGLTTGTFVSKVTYLLFNILFMFVIAVLPRSKCLLISPPDRSISDYCFCFGPAASFFLELLLIALHSFLIAYWTLFALGCSSSDVISFCLFILSMGFLQQEYWFAFPPLVDHILSELFTMTHPSWVALHGMVHSFIGLCKSLCHGQGCDP